MTPPGARVRSGSFLRWLAAFRPRPAPTRAPDVVRSVVGAAVGILLTALVGRSLSWGPAELAWLVAPMGASSVLLFAVPASPLAQPWSIMGGNVVSALIGVAAARTIEDDVLAATVGVSVAVGVMALLGCLHPPGGAVAVAAVLGGPAVEAQGFAFAVWPVGVNSLCLLLVALAYDNAVGRPYPHPVAERTTAEAPPTERVGVRPDDVAAAMRDRSSAPDVLPEDVVALVREAEVRALDRRLGGRTVGDLMARRVEVAHPDDSAYRVRILMNAHGVKAVPVVDADRVVVGIVTMADMFNRDPGDLAPVRDLMTAEVVTVGVDAPLADLVGLMSDRGLRHVPVVARDGVLAGLVTRSELVAALRYALLSAPEGQAGPEET